MPSVNRLGALLESKIERIVVDASHIDQKKRGIFNMKETQEPLMRLLNRPKLRAVNGNEQPTVQLLMY